MSVNYNGKVQNTTAYIKTYTSNNNASSIANLWSTSTIVEDKSNVIIPASPYYSNLYIPGDLYLDGNFINASDKCLKTNIAPITDEQNNKLLNLNTYTFTLKNDKHDKLHYGLIAQEVENDFPELVTNKPNPNPNLNANENEDENSDLTSYKGVNYLELVPLLVKMVQRQQIQIEKQQLQINSLINNNH